MKEGAQISNTYWNKSKTFLQHAYSEYGTQKAMGMLRDRPHDLELIAFCSYNFFFAKTGHRTKSTDGSTRHLGIVLTRKVITSNTEHLVCKLNQNLHGRTRSFGLPDRKFRSRSPDGQYRCRGTASLDLRHHQRVEKTITIINKNIYCNNKNTFVQYHRQKYVRGSKM